MQTHIFIAGNRIDFSRGVAQGTAIYQSSGIDSKTHYLLLELPDDRDIPLLSEDYIVINGGERFSVSDSVPTESNPTLRKGLRPTMNEHKLDQAHSLHHAKLDFAGLAQLDPNFETGDGVFVELRDLPDFQVLPGMQLIVQNDDRFYTSPCGNVGLNRTLEADIESMRQAGFYVELSIEASRTFVILKDFPLPSHWNASKSDLLLQVPQGYPMAAMDMFWLSPHVRLANGQMPQNAEVVETYCDKQWQRFSWHYGADHMWNAAVDGVVSHLRFVRVRLNMPV